MTFKPHKLGKTRRVKPAPCLNCGAPNDAASGIDHSNKPRAGNISICISCGHVATFNADGTLRPLTDEEMHDIAGWETMLAAQHARGEVMALYREKPHAKNAPRPNRAARRRAGRGPLS